MIFFVVLLIIVFGVTTLIFAWQNPSVAPPGGNLSGFLNTSSTAQTKTGALTIATSTYLATTGGNVGIGTTSPGYKLDVNGTTNLAFSNWANAGGYPAYRMMWSGYSGSSYPVLQLGTNSNRIAIGVDLSANASGQFTGNEIVIPNNIAIIAPKAANNDYLGVLRVGSDNKVYLGGSNYQTLGTVVLDVAAGNVGIGTVTPDTKLDIYTAGQSASTMKIKSDQRSDYLTTGGALGQIYFGTDGSGAGTAVVGKIKSYASNGVYQLRFSTYSNEDVLNVYGGNVGIGTTGPGAKLDVVGDIKVSGRMYGTGIASYAVARTQTIFTPPTSLSAAAGSANEIPGLSVTITTHGGDLEIEGTLFLYSAGAYRGAFSASIDGVWVGSYIGAPWPATWTNWYDGIIRNSTAEWDTKTYHRVVPNVPAGTHTVKLLAWNETASGWHINCCSMVSEMVVKELLKQN